MDIPQFDALLQTLGHSRRAVITTVLAIGAGVLGGAGVEAGKHKGRQRRRRRRSRRITLCYQGETIEINAAQERHYPGATAGPCTCTSTTCAAAGKTCGPIDDGCGGALSCGVCEVGPQNSCHNGSCDTCASVCAQNCLGCASLVDGATVCFADTSFYCDLPCATDADCPGTYRCVSVEAYRSDNASRSWPDECGVSSPGVCVFITPC